VHTIAPHQLSVIGFEDLLQVLTAGVVQARNSASAAFPERVASDMVSKKSD